ncbi:MAG: c-type cytochrome, partial [Planctomycetota bacterium]
LRGHGVLGPADARPRRGAALGALVSYGESLAPGPPLLRAAPRPAPPPRRPTTASDRRRAVDRGRRLYRQWCAGCHGERADGNGPAARFLGARPRNFLRGAYKFRSTVTPDPPTDADLFRSIRHGVGIEMPPWPQLGDDQVWDLVELLKGHHPAYVPTELFVEEAGEGVRLAFLRWTKEQHEDPALEGALPDDASGATLGAARLQKRGARWWWRVGGTEREVTDGMEAVVRLEGGERTLVFRLGEPVYDWMADYDPDARVVAVDESPVPYTARSAALGGRIYEEMGCASCHGTHGAGDGPALESSRGALGELVLPAAFRGPATPFKGGVDARSLVRVFLTGISGTPMPSYAGNFAASGVAPPDQARWHLAHYVQSLAGLPFPGD